MRRPHLVLQISPEGNCRNAIGNIRLAAVSQSILQLEGEVRYNCVVRPLVDSRLEQFSARTQDVCSDLLGRIARLKYLGNLEFHFSQCEEMARFIEVTYHAFRTVHVTGPCMRFRYDLESPYYGSGGAARHSDTQYVPPQLKYLGLNYLVSLLQHDFCRK